MRNQQPQVAARYGALLSGLQSDGRIDVVEIADRLGVTPETIRRDLRTLESDGKLHRVHGGAVAVDVMPALPVSPPPIRPEIDGDGQRAGHWVRRQLPRSGTIMIGAGALAPAIAQAMTDDPPEAPGLTVVTTSLDAAVVLSRGGPTLAVYLVGGTVSHQTGGQEGQWALDELTRFAVDLAVVSPTGVDLKHGLGSDTTAAAAINAAMIVSAHQVVAVASAASLGRPAFVRFAGLTDIMLLAVVGHPQPAVLQTFRDGPVPVEILS